ncbi:hypothetical protein ABF87_11465 [Nitrosomonas sp. JL21]|uniref:hypothetical protein n=1 Tax=Nitrosomonas sp. JL21 TaxID=153949 RepID=UPI001372239E|nr:hypothetical protein [Nitrosomonas sp. JL21]MBL8497511.1 hypothetical protein [Nitrosomonas sp.]MXS78561.1 hypothetical protein [Nitrosomonas sp. JL21]
MCHTQFRIDSAWMIFSAIILAIVVPCTARAQSSTDLNQRSLESQPLATQSQPEEMVDQPRPSRKIQRIGTALGTPPGSVSIKSTDAGPAYRRPSRSTCSNCGIIDSINKINLNAIASGVVAGTIAREVIRQAPHQAYTYPHQSGSPYGGYPSTGVIPGHQGPNHSGQYQVGVTMPDGSQSIIVVPDVSHLQHGDRVQLIDGAIVLDRQQ